MTSWTEADVRRARRHVGNLALSANPDCLTASDLLAKALRRIQDLEEALDYVKSELARAQELLKSSKLLRVLD